MSALDINGMSNADLDHLAVRVDRKQVSAIDYKDFLSREFPPRREFTCTVAAHVGPRDVPCSSGRR
jgi:hypothetical protein